MIPRPLDERRKLIRREPLKHDMVPVRRIDSRRLCSAMRGARSVTVCIGALAEHSQAIVVVADRSLSILRDRETILKTDSRIDKVRELPDGWVGAFAGSVDFGLITLSWTIDRHGFPNAPSVPECAKLAFQECRRINIVDRILKPLLLDEEWWRNKTKGNVADHDELFWEVERKIGRFNAGSLLVCGFDGIEPKIYLIRDPGMSDFASGEGFGVIGIGEDIARQRLFTLKTAHHGCVASVLYDVFDAKESCAELLPDVGHEWDAVVVRSNKSIAIVPKEIKLAVEQLYRDHPKSPLHDNADEGRKRAYLDMLRSWSDEVMSATEGGHFTSSATSSIDHK